jgi:ATP-dependent Clp protease ATP-binding subunit ClpA
LNLSEDAVEYLAKNGYDSKMGARPLARKIDELIRVPLSKKILFEKIKSSTVTANLVDNVIVFDVTQKINVEVDSNGFINVVS